MTEDESNRRIDNKIIFILCVMGVILLISLIVLEIGRTPQKFEVKFHPIASTKNVEAPNLSTNNNFEHTAESDSGVKFPIDINRATAKELEAIPNIGPATAKLIVEYRDEFGFFLSMDELLEVKGIGKKTIALLEEYCIIY